MSFPRYPDYKESGVEWLGEVPAHWTVSALDHRYEVALGKMLDAKRIAGKNLAPYLRNVDVQWGEINTGDLPQMDFVGDELTRYRLEPGDLLVCEGGEVGRAAVWKGDIRECYYQKALHRLRPRQHRSDTALFLYYVFVMASRFGAFCGSEGKATIAHLTAETLRRHRFAFPPREEQLNIVVFLNSETAKIDGLIADQQRLVGLLTEKRQAVISHAVTKGLNPDAPMNDSGIEWLGKVPAHWVLTPLKHLVEFRSGGTPSKGDPDYWDGDIPWASAKDMKVETLTDTADHITALAVSKGAASLLPAGTVLVVVRGMILAHTFPVVTAAVPMAINQDLKGLLPRENMSPEYLAWALRGSAVETLRRVDEAGHGTKALRMEEWGGMSIPVPPPKEQKAISRHIQDELSALDALLKDAGAAVNLLQERRTALISAAVTGQIDVRGLVRADDSGIEAETASVAARGAMA